MQRKGLAGIDERPRFEDYAEVSAILMMSSLAVALRLGRALVAVGVGQVQSELGFRLLHWLDLCSSGRAVGSGRTAL